MSTHLFHWADPQKVGTDDTLVCDVPVVEWDYDDRDRFGALAPRPCGAEVYCNWSFTVPIIRGEPTFPEDVGKEAVSSGWEMSCSNGHTHAVSSNQITARDDAEQFDPTIFHAGGKGDR